MYLCGYAARLGGASAIDASIMALGLHEPSRTFLSRAQISARNSSTININK